MSSTTPIIEEGPSAAARPPLIVVTDGVDEAVKDAWTTMSKPLPTQSRGERFLDAVGDKALSVSNSSFVENAPTAKIVANSLIDGFNVDINAVKDNLKTFQQATELVMKGLDQVAKVHPFVTVAVLAFKAVVTLELKRRENNAKILTLHVEMRDTMGMLLQLQSVKDSNTVYPDGTTIAGRMQGVLKGLAEDIKVCGNVCDKYMKKSTIAKVLKAPIYEQKLADCAAAFVQKRKDLKMAMAIHTTLGVDSANKTLDAVQHNVQTTDDKVSMLLVLQQLNSPRDRDLMKWIKTNGGADAFLKNEAMLERLQRHAESMEARPESKGNTTGSAPKGPAQTIKDLKKELNEDFDEALAANMVVFGRKLDVQAQQLKAQLRVESDRVIRALSSHTHERVVENSLRKLWQEMGWKGRVKARHLVLCLHEYFCEKHDQLGEHHHANFLAESPLPSPTHSYVSEAFDDEDAWALEFVNVAHVPPIVERMDDNLSGFVSIKEANAFALARPEGWSFPRWLAYWAAAWPLSISTYREKIYALVRRMFAMLPTVLPENRAVLEVYFDYPVGWVELILNSTNTSTYASTDRTLVAKTESFVESEEKRMKDVLESIRYNVDAVSTVTLITGPGRIEQFLYPLLYLVLRRHFDIIRLAEKYYIHDDEVQSMINSVDNILYAVDERVKNLTMVFEQSSSDVRSRYRAFAFGMFDKYTQGRDRDLRNHSFAKHYAEDGWLDEELRAESENKSTVSTAPATSSDEPTGAEKGGRVADVEQPPGLTTESTQATESNSALPTPPNSIAEQQLTGPSSIGAEGDNQTSPPDVPSEIGESSASPPKPSTSETNPPPAETSTPAATTLPSLDILLHPTVYLADPSVLEVGKSFDFTPVHEDPSVAWPDSLSGIWSGFRVPNGPPSGKDFRGVLTIFDFSSLNDGKITGTAQSVCGLHVVEGTFGQDAQAPIKFTQQAANKAPLHSSPSYFVGNLNPSKEIIHGVWKASEDGPDVGTFTLRRTPPWLQRYRVQKPTGNIGRDLWSFARRAVLAMVQQKTYSWNYFKERARERKYFVELLYKQLRITSTYGPQIPLTQSEADDLNDLKRAIPGPELNFYYLLTNAKLRRLCHSNIGCDTCSCVVRELRFACLQCISDTLVDTIDLCKGCRDTQPSIRSFEHKADHDLILTAKFSPEKDREGIYEAGKNKASSMKSRLRAKLASPPPPEEQEKNGSFGMNCTSCAKPINLPCWADIAEDSERVLCDDCAMMEPPLHLEAIYVRLDRNNVSTEKNPSKESSLLALQDRIIGYEAKLEDIQTTISAHEKSFEDKLKQFDSSLQDKFAAYQSGVESRLSALEERVESRLASIEELLRALIRN